MTDHRPGDRAPSRLTTWWTLTAGATAAWGVLAAVRQLPWQTVVAVLLASGLLASSLALSTDALESDRVDLMRAGRVGALTGLVVVVAIGLAGAAGAVGVGILVVVLLARPGLLDRLRRRVVRSGEGLAARRSGRERLSDGGGTGDGRTGCPDDALGEGRDDAWDRTFPGSLATEHDPFAGTPLANAPSDTAPDWSPTLTVPTHLSDHDLCLAWESSSRALRRCTTASARLEVVRVRQACLDELERRQPDAVRAWVLAGTDPESSPARYLAG